MDNLDLDLKELEKEEVIKIKGKSKGKIVDKKIKNVVLVEKLEKQEPKKGAKKNNNDDKEYIMDNLDLDLKELEKEEVIKGKTKGKIVEKKIKNVVIQNSDKVINTNKPKKELEKEVKKENIVLQNFNYEKDNEYLQNFLKKIKSDTAYKRITISPLRYAGGKSKAIGLILENLPKLKEKKIVSIFFGGGSFELCVSQKLDINVIGYDIFGMLTNFWSVLINDKDKFITELKKFNITKDEFTKNRHILLSYWDKIKPKDLVYKTMKEYTLTDTEKSMLDNDKILQAVYYYYNMTLSYGPMFLGWPSSNEIKVDKFKRRIANLEKLNLKNLSVNNLDFKQSIKKHPNDFLFLDPPYYLGNDSKMFKGMYPNCNFAIHHNNFEHDELCKLLKEHKGGFLLTYNDCETIRNMYKDYKQVFPKWQYTYGQGETRIGTNRENGNETNIKESHEIFIICPPLS